MQHSPDFQSNKKLKTTPHAEDDNSDEKFIEPTILNIEKAKILIKKYFLVEMPDDFYNIWSFCEEYSKDNPRIALKALDLLLVGPFDVLAGTLKEVKDDNHLLHSRYYFDPPEFQVCFLYSEITYSIFIILFKCLNLF